MERDRKTSRYKIIALIFVFFFVGRRRKYIPQSQRFIASSSHHRLTIRRASQIEHAKRVSRQRHNLLHGRILPHHNLIQRVAVRGHNLVAVLAPQQIAHLRASINHFHRFEHAMLRIVVRVLLDRLARNGGVDVPKLNTAIRSTTARRQQSTLMRTPRDSLDRRFMLTITQWLHEWLRRHSRRRGMLRVFVYIANIPNRHFIVIATRRQIQRVVAPFETAHFLLVKHKFLHHIRTIVLYANIAQINIAIA
mmetsp:Transcript_21047/g.33768  ORF Transcript_21047/g.33768 Transcript_21047/m.33768 type:complete len:250 (+) Transcript_21047:289-1038(+)